MSETVGEFDEALRQRIEEAEKGIVAFTYKRPERIGTAKAHVRLGQGGNIRGVVQVVREGGENNLHYHTNADSLWLVLKGRARFYGVGDKLLGEFGPLEGVITPRYSRYWFEKVGDEDLELLQVGALGPGSSSGRTDASPQKYKVHSGEHYSATTP